MLLQIRCKLEIMDVPHSPSEFALQDQEHIFTTEAIRFAKIKSKENTDSYKCVQPEHIFSFFLKKVNLNLIKYHSFECLCS